MDATVTGWTGWPPHLSTLPREVHTPDGNRTAGRRESSQANSPDDRAAAGQH